MGRKRANGEGSITRRADGRYAASITLGWVYDPESGRTRQDRRWKYSRVRREVKEWLDSMIERRDRGDVGSTTARHIRTVGEFLSAWLDEVVRPNRRPKTYLLYEGWVRTYYLPVMGDVPLSDLTARHVVALRNRAAARGVSDATAAQVMMVLSVALNVAVNWGLLSYNPVQRVEKPRVEREERPVLTREQATLLLATVASDRLFALYVLQLMFGFRIGEVCGLQWQDVDLERGRLSVRRQLQWQGASGGGLVLVDLKTRAGRREMDLPRLAVEVLQRHREAQHREALAIGPLWREGGSVFTMPDGGPIDPKRLREQFYRALDAAGLPRIHFHDLRHMAGTRLAEDGVDVKTISTLLGHANSTITRDLYLHTTPRMKRDVADRLDTMFSDMGVGAPAP